eukprot:scaffold32277_cov108-Isochrysis_galbana.AAC.2
MGHALDALGDAMTMICGVEKTSLMLSVLPLARHGTGEGSHRHCNEEGERDGRRVTSESERGRVHPLHRATIRVSSSVHALVWATCCRADG